MKKRIPKALQSRIAALENADHDEQIPPAMRVPKFQPLDEMGGQCYRVSGSTEGVCSK